MKAIVFAAMAVLPVALHAQFNFTLGGRQFQVHSFVQQGFAYSNDNNYLTMKTSQGSFALTDGGANIGMSVTDKFHIGAQVYLRNIGRLGNWHPELDWAYGDYKFANWFGVRAGKVKTALGLYNDTQDMEFLHTWAILPQSAYPLDLRASTISHTGADVYGEIPLRKLGSLTYTVYGGARPYDSRGDKAYVLADYGFPVTKDITGRSAGGDLRWNTPAPGLLLGASFSDIAYNGSAMYARFKLPTNFDTKNDTINAFYADYTYHNLHVNGEYRRNWEVVGFSGAVRFPDVAADQRSWYVAGSYRISKHLELGTYRSQYVYNSQLSAAPPSNHIYDQTITARVDLTKSWNVKFEEHFIDGYGAPTSSHGFYVGDNTGGLKPRTNLLVIRTGWNF